MLAFKSKPILASVLFVWTSSVSALARPQQAAGSESRPPNPVITALSVTPGADHVAVEISFSKRVEAKVSALESPDRLVFDFPGCELAHPNQRLTVNRGAVLAVRAGTFSLTPPVARVVIDLKSVTDHEEIYTANKLVINLKTKAPPAPTSSTASRSGSIPLTAYALLARTKALTVSDLAPLEARARAGDPEAETTLGLAYHEGTLLKFDDAEALRLLQQAANQGFVAAEEAMGMFCQSGFGMSPDKAQAVSWYTKAARGGSRDAATNLALMYSTGDGMEKDPGKAANWFHAAADAGDATAQLNLAALYHRGEGVQQDDGQAVLWLTKAADQGLLPAMIELAKWNLQPEHGNNIDAAIGWCRKAADKGDATAQAVLGDIFSDEKLGRQNYSQAVLWYRKAAEQGQREGEFGLGSRYLLGQGVLQDMGEARHWLTPAANQGHPYAQLLLAKMFEEGQGGPADVASARKYYEEAANFGISEAQYRLGLMLAHDRGDAASLPAAYKWLILAQNSVKESAPAARALRNSLTPDQLAQAEHDVDDWRTAHPAQPSSQ